MGARSIEDAVLAFARTVKNDPGLTDLLRDALHELEVAIDPSSAEQQPQDGNGSSSSAGDTPAEPDDGGTQLSPAGSTPPPPGEPGAPPIDTPGEPGTQGA